MAKFVIPKITRPLYLGNYEPELSEVVINVWVNPPKQLRLNYYLIIRDLYAAMPNDNAEDLDAISAELKAITDRLTAWLAEIWSQGEPETHWTPEEIHELMDHCLDTDPGLWKWLVDHTEKMITEHITRQKKA